MGWLGKLFSLEGLVSLAITAPLVIGALVKLRVRSARVDVRSNSPTVQGTGHTVVTGGAAGATVVSGQGHTVSITRDALRPGEGLALGFWGLVSVIGLVGAVLFVPYAANVIVIVELLACFALPALALRAVIDIGRAGRRTGAAVAYLLFTLVISWVVLRNYSGLEFLPEYAPSFRPSFDALFLDGRGNRDDLVNILILASAALGLALLVVAHTRTGLSYLAQDRGVTHATQNGLLTSVGVLSATLLATGFGQALWFALSVQGDRNVYNFIRAAAARTFPFF